MKFFLVAALVAIARADVSHLPASSGYEYRSPVPENSPLSSYGVPQSSVLGNTAYEVKPEQQQQQQQQLQFTLPHSSGQSVDFLSVSGTPVTTYGQPSASFQASTPAPGVPSVNFVTYQQPSNSFQLLSQYSPAPNNLASVGSFESSRQTETSGGRIDDAFGVSVDAPQQGAVPEPEVSKNLYFFAAPEEEEQEEVRTRVELPPQPPKKAYKIIFIKAPTYRNQQTITIPAPPVTEEKTLVYVLVKKPENQPKVRFENGPAPTQPPKPEVFFIKYKTQKEAEAAVAEIQSKHGASGEVIANLPAGTGTSGSFGGSENFLVSSTPSSPPAAAYFGNNAISQESVQIGGEGGNQFTAFQSPVTPVTFGSNSVDSFQVFGGGIAAAAAAASAEAGQQEESSEAPAATGTEENTTGDEKSNGNQEASAPAAFSAYGPPKF